MYKNYVEKCEADGYVAKCDKLYKTVFETQNLYFQSPSSDICKTCDGFRAKLRNTRTLDERKKIEADREKQHFKADYAYACKKKKTKYH